MLARPEIRDIMDNFNELAVDAVVRVTYKEEQMGQVLADLAQMMNTMRQLTEVMLELRRERREKEPLTDAEEAACDRREQRVERALASAEQRLRKVVDWLGTGWHFAYRW